MSGIFSVNDLIEIYLGGMKVSKSKDIFSENKCYFITSIIAFVILYIVFPIVWANAPPSHDARSTMFLQIWIIGGIFVLGRTCNSVSSDDATKLFLKNQMTIGKLVNTIDQAIKGSPAMCLRVIAYHQGKKARKIITDDQEHSYRILAYKDLSDRISSLSFLKEQPIFKLDMKKIVSKTPICENQMHLF